MAIENVTVTAKPSSHSDTTLRGGQCHRVKKLMFISDASSFFGNFKT